MTTPSGGPVVVPIGNTPSQLCPALGGGQTVFIQNTDDTANLYVGTSSSLQIGNALLVAAGASVIQDATRTIFAFTDSSNPPINVQIDPGTAQYNLAPSQILSLINITALATAIAEAIAETGVSLLGQPTLLYDNSQPTPVGTPGNVGATISNHWFPSGTTPSQAITLMNGYVGLPLGNIVERVYYGDGKYPSLTDEPLAAYIAAGAKLQLCLKPLLTGLTNPTIAASEQANIAATITLLNGATYPGGGAVKYDIVLYTEANLPSSEFTSALQYQQYIALYGPTVRSRGVKLVYNPASYNMPNAVSYYSGDASFDAWSLDYYGTDWKQGILPFAEIEALTNLPVGISEWNAVSAAGDMLTTAQFTSYTNYIISVFSARLANGLDNYDIILYTGYNASPLNQINSNADWKIPQIVAMYDALAAAPPSTPGVVINANSSKTVPPINPSPGGGFAMMNNISYDSVINLVSNAAGSTNPFVTLQMNWLNVDAAGAIAVAEQRWSIPIGTTATVGSIIQGRGPQHGQYVQIKAINQDTVACTLTLQVNSTSRNVNEHDWYWDAVAGVNIPGFTESNIGAAYANSLLSINATSIPANGSKSFITSMSACEATVSCSTGTGTALQFLLVPLPTSVFGGGAIYDETTTNDSRNIFLPRGPCLMTIVNPSGSAENAFVEIVKQP
jgi:hypothetical protein